MIELKKVNKSYGAQKVLDDITVTLERGRVHGFVGRNGSGKTVLMKCIAGLARPDSGEVLVDGRHIGTELENPPDMGAIIEVPGFLPNASGYKNLKYLADISGRAGDREIRAAMEKCGLDPDSRKWVSKYSLGMRQRLGIAQAVLNDPEVLVLDEPTAGLDPKERVRFRNLISGFSQDKIVVLSTHIVSDLSLIHI